MRALILGLTLTILAGCASNEGFSTGGLPSRIPQQLYHIYIETNEPESPLHEALRQEFRAQGMRVADMRTETKSVMRISREMTQHALDCRYHDIAHCPSFRARLEDMLVDF